MIIDGYEFNSVEQELEQKVVKLFEVIECLEDEHLGFCEFKSIETGQEYMASYLGIGCHEWPKKGDLIRGYLFAELVYVLKTNNQSDTYFKKEVRTCAIEGCFEVLDIDVADDTDRYALCQIPGEDEYIIVCFDSGEQVTRGDRFTFNGSLGIGKYLYGDKKVFDGEKTIWNMMG